MRSRSANSTADSRDAKATIEPRYRGRFAPSPTGPLHLGSLLAAVASFVDARARAGHWLLRIEDIDGPRTSSGAIDAIRRTLARHALEWDAEAPRQSERTERYHQALMRLADKGLTFECDCSRSRLANSSIYPGTCRARTFVGPKPTKPDRAIRVRVPPGSFAFSDRLQGSFGQNLEQAVGDFVIVRRDGIFAYQLAVVVDDADQRIDNVVRGADLLDNTPRQLFLMDALEISPPQYLHIPVLCGRDGQKLSKQTYAGSIDQHRASDNLRLVLELLGQAPPAELRNAPAHTVIDWACHNWHVDRIPTGSVLTNYWGLC